MTTLGDRVKGLAQPPAPGKPYTVPIAGSKRDGRSEVYRNWHFQDHLVETYDTKIRTIHDGFEDTVRKVPNNRLFGRRPYDTTSKTYGAYEWQDYKSIAERRRNLGSGLIKLHRDIGVTGGKFGVGLWSQNRPEWQITDLACQSQSLFSVSLYDTLGPDAVEYIISHAELKAVATSLNHIMALLKLKPRLPNLQLIISLDPIDGGELPGESKRDILNAIAQDQGIKIHYIRDVEALGASNPLPMNPPQPDDIITINYTSGTTGNPKGVVLTHRNALAAATSASGTIGVTGSDILCSFLPLAHIYQRLNEHLAFVTGGSIGYFHGDIAALVDDIKLVRPTVFSAVPRLFNRFGAAVRTAAIDAPGFKGTLSRHVVSTKLANIKNPNPAAATNKHFLYDRIWSKKVASQFGLERVRYMVSGASPIDPDLQQLLRIVFANTFAQGYGMTESYATSLMQVPGDMTASTCGPLFPCNEACLRDVPDMDYLSSDKPHPRGELLLRGPNIFREYLKDSKETAKALDEDGWLHTGDIASVDALGRFKIIDRVKNLLKLAHGEYISPERIENAMLSAIPWLATAYVHGDGTQSTLVGLFGVSPDVFPVWAGKILNKEIRVGDMQAIRDAAADRRIVEATAQALDKAASAARLNGFEKVKAVWLGVDPFTVENDLLTPTLKTKRPKVAKAYRPVIDELYSQVEAQEAVKTKAKAKL